MLHLQDDLHEEDRVQIKNFYRPIEGIVPISEIKASTTRPIPTDGDRHCHPSLRVLKCGLKTGWTIAEAASIRSDCQRTRGHISMEIFIPNAFALAQFSAVGDSGSIVFDFRGRAVGMIHGGNAKEGSTENIATYATPIEDLLKDIEQELGVSVAIA